MALDRNGTAGGVAVRVEEVVKSYAAATSAVVALRGVSLEVQRGERVALLGKSGSGKLTLLNLIGGLDRPTSGRIEAAGSDLARMTGDQLAAYRLSAVGMIFQAYNLIPSRTAIENVELPMVLAGVAPGERRAAAAAALEAVGLGARLGHRPMELSGGEHQRVAIAGAGEPARHPAGRRADRQPRFRHGRRDHGVVARPPAPRGHDNDHGHPR